MTVPQAGYVLVAVVWIVVLAPVIRGLVTFLRTTRLGDLIPKVRVVMKKSPVTHVVSSQRARLDPSRWIPISPWCYRRKA